MRAGPSVVAAAIGTFGAHTVAPAQEAFRSAPISDVAYEVAFDAGTAGRRALQVAMTFSVSGTEPVVLSLPAWTPGAYEMSNFARKISGFGAEAGDGGLHWDKLDFDTWRVFPRASGLVTVRFDFVADTLDNAMAWSQPDFTFVNGTNVFLYPEGRGFDFTSRVVVRTEPEWRVATGMRSAGTPRTYRAESYHEVVDMPLFIGRFDLDSAEIDGRWYRLATYPEGALHGEARSTMWDHIRRMVPPQVAVFGETPWDSYTTLIVFEPSFPGGSALEHANSHLGIYATTFIGSPVLALITAHEMFHAWNVKRLRPSDLVPYDYSRPQPTPLLWVSEGITDYYADLAIVRGGIVPPSLFYQITGSKVSTVAEAPPVALEDASLSTWISPTDGTATIYYPKGSLAGMLLDILIRDATDNEASLDDVMRALYEATYRRGHGFTTDDWWRMVTRVAEGRRFDDFYSRYVDGRESFPWAEVLPLAGLELDADSTPTPRLGVFIASDSAGVRVTDLAAGGAAADAGVRKGDYLLRVGDVEVRDADFGSTFRARYGTAAEGTPLEIVVRRNGATERIASELRFIHTVSYAIREQRDASPKARRIRAGILGSASPPGGH